MQHHLGRGSTCQSSVRIRGDGNGRVVCLLSLVKEGGATVNPSQQGPRTLETYPGAIIISTNASVVQIKVNEATGRVENSEIFHPDFSGLTLLFHPGGTQIIALCVCGKVLWELFVQSRGCIFSRSVHIINLLLSLWGPCGGKAPHPDKGLIGKTAGCDRGGMGVHVPGTEAHVLCNVFPASSYLPVLLSVSTVLVVVFFVL